MKTVPNDQIWAQVRVEANRDAEAEPALAGFLHEAILRHPSLESALSSLLAGKLANHAMTASALECLIDDALIDPDIRDAVLCDLQAVVTRDPATLGYTQPFAADRAATKKIAFMMCAAGTPVSSRTRTNGDSLTVPPPCAQATKCA